MESLFNIGLTNAVLVIPLALIVYVVTRIWRNPQAAHVLWLLVLIKLVTPPVFEIRIPWLVSSSPDPISTTGHVPREIRGTDRVPVADRIGLPWAETIDGEQTASIVEPSGSDAQELPGAVAEPAAATTTARWAWSTWVFAAWLTGSIGFAALLLSRVMRFQRLLRHATPAGPQLLVMVDETARELGVRRAPRLLVMTGRVPPLLWPIGRRPTIVLPVDLIGKLSESQLRHVLAHELAHVARRDHWVRWFETAVALLYWWHPVFWLAGHRLRTAEEACCDALVVRRCRSTTARHYAGTLLEIVEFATATVAPPSALGSGMGGSTQLKRRIEMLLLDRVPARLSVLTKLCLLVAAIAVLPLSAVAWQAEKQIGQTPPLDDTPPPVEELEPDEPRSVRGMRVVIELPEAPYRIASGDLLEINAPVSGTLPDAPIQGLHVVEPGGAVQLGPEYGRVAIGGLTLEEAENAVEQHLSARILEPAIAITIGGWRSGGKQKQTSIDKMPYRIAPGDLLEIKVPANRTIPDAAIQGLHLVEPGGAVQLGPEYGRVAIGGLTLEEAENAVEQHLSARILEPVVAITIGGWKLAMEKTRESHAAGGLDEELVAALREFVAFLELNHQRTEALYKNAGAPRTDLLFAAYELSTARGELALAEGDLEEALNQRKQARDAAEDCVKMFQAMRASNQGPDEQLVTKAANNLLQAKVQLIAAKRAAGAAGDAALRRP